MRQSEEFRDNRSPLMKRLAELLPKEDQEPWKDRIRLEPIRQSTDAFCHYFMQDDMPADPKEMRDVLYVFGKMLCGNMERMIDYQQRLTERVLAAKPGPVMWP